MPIPTDELRQALERLVRQPAELDRLLPGYRLVKRPLTPKERAALTLPKANAVRRSRQGDKLAEIHGEISAMIAADPAISPGRIIRELERRNIKAPRGGMWTTRTLRVIMGKMNEGEQTPT